MEWLTDMQLLALESLRCKHNVNDLFDCQLLTIATMFLTGRAAALLLGELAGLPCEN